MCTLCSFASRYPKNQKNSKPPALLLNTQLLNTQLLNTQLLNTQQFSAAVMAKSVAADQQSSLVDR